MNGDGDGNCEKWGPDPAPKSAPKINEAVCEVLLLLLLLLLLMMMMMMMMMIIIIIIIIIRLTTFYLRSDENRLCAFNDCDEVRSWRAMGDLAVFVPGTVITIIRVLIMSIIITDISVRRVVMTESARAAGRRRRWDLPVFALSIVLL